VRRSYGNLFRGVGGRRPLKKKKKVAKRSLVGGKEKSRTISIFLFFTGVETVLRGAAGQRSAGRV